MQGGARPWALGQPLGAAQRGAAPLSEDARLLGLLKYQFGLESFRPLQLEAIKATLAGRDSVLVLPTGGRLPCYLNVML